MSELGDMAREPPDAAHAASDAPEPSTAVLPDPRALLSIDKSIRKGVLGYAFKRTRHLARAKDLSQEAMVRVLQGRGWYRWDPARDKEPLPPAKSLFNHLCSVVDTVLSNENQRASTKREGGADDDGDDPPARPLDERAPDSRPNAEALLGEHDDRQAKLALAARVMARVGNHHIIPRLLELEQQGVEDGAELANRLGCTVKEIYRARELLAYHRDCVLEEEEMRRKWKGGAP